MSNININLKQSASQADRILDYMQQGNTITPLEALHLFGCFRLTSRICDLEDKGYSFKREWKKLPDGKQVMSYSLNNNNLKS
jgi:hypothetical protein